jgi:hypothetical protein
MQQIYADLPPELRRQAIKDDAVQVLSEKFYQPLSDQDAEEKKRSLLRVLDEIDEVGLEAAKSAADYKDQIKTKTVHAKTIRIELRSGQQEVDGKLYGIPDYTGNKMHYYSEDGSWIRSRNLLPEERQHQISFGGATYQGLDESGAAVFKVS